MYTMRSEIQASLERERVNNRNIWNNRIRNHMVFWLYFIYYGDESNFFQRPHSRRETGKSNSIGQPKRPLVNELYIHKMHKNAPMSINASTVSYTTTQSIANSQ